MPGNPPTKATFQAGYHLFLDLAATVGATDTRFKHADPVMGSTDAPAPADGDQYVIQAIHVSVAANTEIQILNGDGTVYKLDVAGGNGGMAIPLPAGLPVGKGKYPRLTMDTTEKITIHLFCKVEPEPFAPPGTC